MTAARQLGVAPWELLDHPESELWIKVGLAARTAENFAHAEAMRRAGG